MDSGTSAIVLSGDLPRSTLSQMLARGVVKRLAAGIYTTDTSSAPERVTRREWRTIAGRLFPDATISDRSARTAGPVEETLYLVYPHNDRTLYLARAHRVTAPRGRSPTRRHPTTQRSAPSLARPGSRRKRDALTGRAAAHFLVGSPATNSANGSSERRDLAVPTNSVRYATKCARWHHCSGSAPRMLAT